MGQSRRVFTQNQASGIETGDHWQASHRPGRSRSRDHAESVTALEARDHWRSPRCLLGQEAAQASREELARLTQELARVTQERDFQKSVAAYFTKAAL